MKTMSKSLQDTYDRLDTAYAIARGVISGRIRSLVLTGPGGIGKSHVINKALNDETYDRTRPKNVDDFLSLGEDDFYTIIKGRIRPLALYETFYQYKDAGKIVILDDADDVMKDIIGLNLIKGALDTANRTITWASKAVSKDVPTQFEFNGGLIAISNMKLEGSGSLEEHLEAVFTRIHKVDIGLHNKNDRLEYIIDVYEKTNMLQTYGMSEKHEHDIIEYMIRNVDNLQDVSLRMGLKLADLIITDTSKWQLMAKHSCLNV